MNNDFLDDLPDDPMLALNLISKKYFEFDKWAKRKAKEELSKNNNMLSDDVVLHPNKNYHSSYVEFFGLFQAYSETNNIEFIYPKMVSDLQENAINIYKFFVESKKIIDKEITNLTLARVKNKYSTQFGKKFSYEFSMGDIQKLQDIFNLLRDEISATQSLEDDHKSRLLKRLENIQLELHKKVSDLDRFWGLVGDAGVVTAKLGSNAKPIVDRIKEISEIIWRTQSRAEELPSDAPLALLDTAKDETE